MAAVESQMLELGTEAPAFALPDPEGQVHGLKAGSSAYLVMFICNHCPFVKHVADELAAIGRDYTDRGVDLIAINSNDVDNYPADAPERMREEATARGYGFPYVLDDDQSVAKAFRAACTPDFFVFDAAQKLVYRGRLDASRPSNGVPVTGRDVRDALDAVLAGDTPTASQVPSIGCNIKWKPGNAPAYF